MRQRAIRSLVITVTILVSGVGLILGLSVTTRWDSGQGILTGQVATPTPPYDDVDYITFSFNEAVYTGPLTRANISTFVARASVAEVLTATFNTTTGVASVLDYASYEDVGPFDNVAITATLTVTETEQLYRDWVAGGGLVSPVDILRLAILDIDTVYKGISTTEKLVLILPGGEITDTSKVHTGETYQEVGFHSDLQQGDDIIIFSMQLWEWQAQNRNAYPFVDRCLTKAGQLSQSYEARCEMIGAIYYIDPNNEERVSSPDTNHEWFMVTAVETQIANAVATEATTSTLPYYADPDYKIGSWPVPTP